MNAHAGQAASIPALRRAASIFPVRDLAASLAFYQNTLGLHISMIDFIMGGDFMAVLDQRIRLDDLISRKKRHASETGHCYLQVTKVFTDPE